MATADTNNTPALGGDKLPSRKPYQPLKRTIHRVEHYGQEYVLEDIIERMSQGNKLSAAIRAAYPAIPAGSVTPLATKIKKHPYFQAYKDASLKLLHDKGAALQQNMLDLALNSRSDMVKFSATKDSLDRIYGSAEEAAGAAPPMTFNFSFGGSAPASSKTVQVIDGEVV